MTRQSSVRKDKRVIDQASRTRGNVLTQTILSDIKGDQKKGYLFFGSFFQPTSNVGISETVCPNGLKFEVQIVLDRVPFQIKFYVI